MSEPARLAVIGIGQELRGDDAAGLLVIRKLKERAGDQEAILLIEAGPAPENFTGLVRRFQPGIVILVDAALMGLAPGMWRYLDWRDTTSFSPSSHTMPLNLLGSYLESELGCTVELIGIQPLDNEFDRPPSLPVMQAVEAVAETIWRRNA